MRQMNYEQALTKLGVKWEYADKVPVDSINATRGLQMQARLQPLDHNLIDTYAAMLVDGYEPPPLLLWKHGKSMLIPLDGNQRIAANLQVAKKHRLNHFAAYIVTTDDPMVSDRICWTWNNMVNGRRLSYEECLEHAITFVRKYGQSIQQSAKEWSVKAWELQSKITVLEMNELAGKAGFEIPPTVSNQSLVILNQTRKLGDDVATKAIKVASENGFSENDSKALIKAIQHAPTAEKKVAAIDTFAQSETIRQRKAETKGGRMRPMKLPRLQLQSQLDNMENLFERFPDKAAFKPVGHEDKAHYRDSARICCNHMIRIYGLGSLLNGGE